MEFAGLISRQDAIAAVPERKSKTLSRRRVKQAQAVANRIRFAVPEASKPLGQQVKELTAALAAKNAEFDKLKDAHAILAAERDSLIVERDKLKAAVAA